MNLSASRLILGGGGLAAACALICCTAPLLVFVVPGVALLIGWAAEAIEVGLVAAIVLGALTAVGVLAWRRRHGSCSRHAGCTCGCSVDTPFTLGQLHWPVQRRESSSG